MGEDFAMILIRETLGCGGFWSRASSSLCTQFAPGAQRFAGIGLPYPHLRLAPFVGGVEIPAGAAGILLNFFAGDAALLMLAVIVVALITTKAPSTGWGGSSARSP